MTPIQRLKYAQKLIRQVDDLDSLACFHRVIDSHDTAAHLTRDANSRAKRAYRHLGYLSRHNPEVFEVL